MCTRKSRNSNQIKIVNIIMFDLLCYSYCNAVDAV